jgi:hypothetical protein
LKIAASPNDSPLSTWFRSKKRLSFFEYLKRNYLKNFILID